MSELLPEPIVRRIADLARLNLSDDQLRAYRKQLAGVLLHIDTLEEIDVENVDPLVHPGAQTNHLDDDQVTPSLPAETVLDLAPATEGAFLTVPKVIDSGSA